jgi:hypothetical protein
VALTATLAASIAIWNGANKLAAACSAVAALAWAASVVMGLRAARKQPPA